MKEPVWIGALETLVLHDLGLVAFGGAAGVRDFGALESALARPRNLRAYRKKRPSLPQLAAAYAFGIIKNHSCVDGNKRTALVIAFAFLEVNGVAINASEEDAYRVFMDLASGRMSEEELGTWICDNSE
jgi:death on curing protein